MFVLADPATPMLVTRYIRVCREVMTEIHRLSEGKVLVVILWPIMSVHDRIRSVVLRLLASI